VLAEGIAFLAWWVTPDRPSAVLAGRVGGLLFFAFHHVGLVIGVNASLASGQAVAPIPLSLAGRAVVALAALTGTWLVLWLLWLGGRAAADRVGGGPPVRALAGAAVAPLYAAICFGASYLVRFSQPRSPGGVGVAASLRVSPLAAFLWPLGLGLAAGLAGGFGSAFRAARAGRTDAVDPVTSPVARPGPAALPTGAAGEPATGWWWLRGTVAGGWRMLTAGLAMAFAGLLVLAILKPDATRAYLSPFDRNTARGVLVVALTLLVLPNLQAWVLFPAMGGCTGVWGRVSSCLLSYRQFPGGRAAALASARPFAVDFPSVPPGYYLFLLVPLVAVLLGGHRAARAGRAHGRGAGAALGALAGVAFAALAAALAVLAGIGFRFSGPSPGALGSIGNGFDLGPNPYLGALVALGWGVIGGALGGLLASPVPRPVAQPPPGPGEPLPATGPGEPLPATGPGEPPPPPPAGPSEPSGSTVEGLAPPEPDPEPRSGP
jgi:hypothetical protein